MAAHRSGIKRILLPARNEKDLIDVSEEVIEELEFFFVDHVSQLPTLVFEDGWEYPEPPAPAADDDETSN